MSFLRSLCLRNRPCISRSFKHVSVFGWLFLEFRPLKSHLIYKSCFMFHTSHLFGLHTVVFPPREEACSQSQNTRLSPTPCQGPTTFMADWGDSQNTTESLRLQPARSENTQQGTSTDGQTHRQLPTLRIGWSRQPPACLIWPCANECRKSHLQPQINSRTFPESH